MSASSTTMFLLGREDAKAIVELERACFPLAWDETMYESVLPAERQRVQDILDHTDQVELPDFLILGLLEDGYVLGYICIRCMIAVECAEIYNVAVQPRLQGQGIGTALLRQAIEILEQQGIREILLEVRSDNYPALTLYRHNGFVPCGVRKGYYPGGEDAVLMQRKTK